MLNIMHLMSDPEGNSFVFPRVLMFSETNSRETSGLTLGLQAYWKPGVSINLVARYFVGLFIIIIIIIIFRFLYLGK